LTPFSGKNAYKGADSVDTNVSLPDIIPTRRMSIDATIDTSIPDVKKKKVKRK
jgi:hypothetical protein